MSLGGIPPIWGKGSPEFRAKRKLIKLEFVEKSQLPFRVLKRRTGVVLGSYKTIEEVETFIDRLSLEQLDTKVSRGRTGRT